MTKEELEKEAKDFAIKSYGNDAFTQANMPHMIEPVRLNLKIGYLAGAEPREKRIAELEKRCNELFFQVNEKTERIADLEKENAELKLKLEALEGQTPWKDIKDKSEVIGQLTKAKVFIRSLKSLIEDVCDINYLSKDNTRLLVEAEQFLNSEGK